MYVYYSSECLHWVDPVVKDAVTVHARSKGIKKTFKKGTIILHEGDIVEYAYFVEKGWAAYYLCNPCGELRIACLVGPGRVFGLGPAFDQLPINLSVKAVEDCEIRMVSRKDLIQAMREDINLGIEMVSNVTMRLRCIFEAVKLFSSLSTPKERLVYYFVSLLQSDECIQYGDWHELPVNLPHKQIGEIIGASRVTVCRMIGHYKTLGKIRTIRQKLLVRKEFWLEEYSRLGLQ